MQTEKTIGALLLTGAVGVFIPYTVLTIIFEYPLILRQDTAIILTRFHEAGNRLIWTWFAFALTGLPLLPAYILIGKKLEHRSSLTRVATTIGVIGLVVQMIGLLRWTFVIPVIATEFVTATDTAVKAAAIFSFRTIHQFAGVLLGEHLGQLFTIIWTVLISIIFLKIKLFPKWISVLGIVSSFIYVFAQAELIATVIPGFPVWNMAGFIGSTLWLLWLIILGIYFIRMKKQEDI
jgi:hypothetical protein